MKYYTDPRSYDEIEKTLIDLEYHVTNAPRTEDQMIEILKRLNTIQSKVIEWFNHPNFKAWDEIFKTPPQNLEP